MISLDTETSGLDIRHGAKPFFVTSANERGEITFWEWAVDPLTRQPIIPEGDIQDINTLISSDTLVLHNPKFDRLALDSIGVKGWNWGAVYDTLMGSHILASNQPHDLTSLALHYLGVDIQPLELALQKACNKARDYARRYLPRWKIAHRSLPEMPSAKETVWQYDTWLPRAICKRLDHVKDHPWWTVLQEYANADSVVTIQLYNALMEEIRRRGLEEQYLNRLKLLPIVYEMESRGVTISGERMSQLVDQYKRESEKLGSVCVGIAKTYGYGLQLPNGAANNKSLTTFCFGERRKVKVMSGGYEYEREEVVNKLLGLPVVLLTDTGAPSLSKESFEIYRDTLPLRTLQREFIVTLSKKRKMDKCLTDLAGYTRFRIRIHEGVDWWTLHPSLNPTGTVTTRWSCSNPNEQNIAKDPVDGYSIRYIFGPAPGREWWSLDAKNIELRIPAYESGQEEFIALFEAPDDPPYFGSNHLLVAHILHPKLFDECRDDKGQLDGRIFKKRYAATWYQWVKNGNFAVQYGAIEESGTADRAYHVKGAQHIIQARFTKQAKLNDYWIKFAERHGYVETIPDKSIDPKRGYPLMVTRTEFGKILPTVPLNYHVQGTACIWMQQGMLRSQKQLDEWNREEARKRGKFIKALHGYAMVMQIHDELVFDFPKGPDPRVDPEGSNLGRIREIQRLMASGGDSINIPTPCGVEYHPEVWSEGITF